jgi:excisionase family DNA binding protein
MLTVEEVAAILKVQPLTVRQMFRESRIRGFKIGKAWRTTMPILEEDIACMSRGVKPPRLEQAAPAADGQLEETATPVRRRRAKAVPETVSEQAAPEQNAAPETAPAAAETAPAAAETAPAAPETAPAAAESVPAAAMESAAPQEAPAAEESDAGGRRKRKSAAEENTEQQLLF